eukprot:9298709-Alexandrium_andersonii.AAC.1
MPHCPPRTHASVSQYKLSPLELRISCRMFNSGCPPYQVTEEVKEAEVKVTEAQEPSAGRPCRSPERRR